MSNVTASFDEVPLSEDPKDDDGDNLHSRHYGKKVSCGDDSSREKPMHEAVGDDSFTNGPPNSSIIDGMHKDHTHGYVHGLHGAQHDDPSSNAAMVDVLENADAEIGQMLDIGGLPSCAFESLPHAHGQSLPSQITLSKYILGEREHGSVTADATSGMPTSLRADCSSDKQPMLAFDTTVAHQSPEKHSDTPCKNSKDMPYNGTMDCLSKNGAFHGHGEIPESTAYGHSGWQSSQNCFTGSNSYSTLSHIGKPPDEVLNTNCSIGRCTQEKACPVFGFSDSSAAEQTLVADKGESAQFLFQGTVENYDNREVATNYRFSKIATGQPVPEEPSTYKPIGGEDLKVKLEYTAFSSPAQNLTTKDGSMFSQSSYYTSQSGNMKNLALMLRVGSAVFSLIAFSVIISNSEKRVAAGSTFYVRFSDYQAYNYLIAINLLTFLYSSGQLILLARGRTSRILSSPIKSGASLYLCDQMLALFMVSSSSSAATASVLSRHGLHNIWPPACSTWKLSLFCSRADVAIGMSFVSCLFMFLSTFSSGYHLSNLLAE